MSMEQKEHAQKKPTAYTDTKKDTKKKTLLYRPSHEGRWSYRRL